MGILKHVGILLICCLAVLATACGGSQMSELSGSMTTEDSTANTTLDLSSYEPDAVAGMPQLPLEEGTERSSSDWDISLTQVLGSDYLLQTGSLVDGTDLLIGAGEGSVQGENGNFAYAMYRLSCEPGTRPLSLNIECTPSGLDEPYFVAVANYTDLRWSWFGPVNLPEFQLELAGINKQFSTHLGNRVTPYLHSIWPKTRDNVSPAIAESLGRLCVAAQDAFPEALTLLRAWLQPPAHPDYLVHLLHEAGLCGKFPEQALDFLSLVIGDQAQWAPTDLGACLEALRTTAPALETDPRYEDLVTYLRQRGGG